MPNFEIDINFDVNKGELEEAVKNINALTDENGRIVEIQTDVDDSQLDEAKAKEEGLNDTANEDIIVDDDQVDSAKDKIDGMDGKTISVNVSMQNLSQGLSQAKTGFSELKRNVDEVAIAGTQMEQNFAFLSMNEGTEKAKKDMQQINDIVASMPGDDNTMRSVLSTAQALGNNLKPGEMEAATKTMADYMAGSATMGKMAAESQQDIMKYLLDGNTAELERGSIVASQIDKLKEATTFQERQVAMQEVLNELGYGGIASQDTMLNKQAEWEGMIYNSKSALSSMWLDAEKGAMDFILKLNEGSNGLLGMGIVAGQMVAGPMTELLGGIGQVATGIKSLRDVYKDLTVMETIANAIEGEGAIAHMAAALGITTEAAAADGAAVSFGGLAIAEGAALWPILAIIGALALLGVAVYEVGKYFGWWTNVGSMIDAISAGLQRLWSAFINNPDVQSFIQGIKDAWNGVVAALSPVISQVMSFFGISQGGEFDIVRALIMGISAAWGNIKSAIMLVIQVVAIFINRVARGIARAKQIIQTLKTKWDDVKNGIRGAVGSIKDAITAPFQKAWGIVKPIYDKFETAVNWGKKLIGWSGAEFEGFNTGSVGYEGVQYEGFDNNTLNGAIASSASNSSNVTNNFHINGIIEEEASQYIVNSVNDYVKKQNLIRGV